MKNNSNVPMDFKITLDSLAQESKKECELKRFINLNDTKYKTTIGPNNYYGLSCFDVYPINGFISGGSKIDLKITFAPDHASELYADMLRISLTSAEKNSRIIQLLGKSKTKNMYIKGVEYLTSNSNNESMLLNEIEPGSNTDKKAAGKDEKDKKSEKASSKGDEKNVEELNVPIPILVTLYSISKSIGEYSQAEKVIQIGCIKSNISSDKKDAKKNGDFSFDNVKEINSKGFNIDLTKVMLSI